MVSRCDDNGISARGDNASIEDGTPLVPTSNPPTPLANSSQ